MSRPVSLALAQLPPVSQFSEFQERLEHEVRAHPSSELFVYPEFHLATPPNNEVTPEFIADAAEHLDGPRGKVLAELAGDLGIWLVPGSVYERADDGTVYNTAVAYSPEGKLVASYRKIFPW
ncbi:carbon-nitrogen hydrolase family protein, partial [Arthrobacter sp. NPDC056886]|uniref:carbon-nitrogen hydrolase family protein n=1 Tax=Arthrobacter sp. NPDC056886 TaxID=3345960 RepID=UPI00366B27E0